MFTISKEKLSDQPDLDELYQRPRSINFSFIILTFLFKNFHKKFHLMHTNINNNLLFCAF